MNGFWKRGLVLGALALLCFARVSFAADDPSIHDVYTAAEAGRMTEAQAMMDKVLKDHPESGRAHYVEAELLAKQGRMSGAQSELATAEHLAPGLPFAQPQAVRELQARIGGHPVQQGVVQAAPAGRTPWGLIVFGLVLLAIVIFAVRAMTRPRVMPMSGGPYPVYPPGAQPPYGGTPYGGAPYGGGPVMGGGGGIGSGIMGGLATGAAVGAGMVAGEALMHHFTDRNGGGVIPEAQASDSWNAPADNMGGNDFGMSDSGGGWDDSGGGGGGGGDW